MNTSRQALCLACILTINYCLYKLIVKVFEMVTLLYISLISLSSISFIVFVVRDVKRLGLISFLPEKIKRFLLERSLFDILMDVWYMPSDLDKLIELMIPFLYNYPPDQTEVYLNRLENNYKSVFTKRVFHEF